MTLRERRKKLGWSQERLAEASGISAGTIGKLERSGHASEETIKALVLALREGEDARWKLRRRAARFEVARAR